MGVFTPAKDVFTVMSLSYTTDCVCIILLLPFLNSEKVAFAPPKFILCMHLCGVFVCLFVCLLCSLQHVQSDSAKCRGWIRLAVNECSLASYITVLCQDSYILTSYYETYSFVRDPEMTSTLTELLAGVTLIAFNL